MELYTRPYLDRVPWLSVINMADEVIPPFSVVWNDADDDVWKNVGGHILIPVRKGDNESSFSIHGGQVWLLTGPFPIRPGQRGIASAPTENCFMLAAIDSEESATYTENLVAGPKFTQVGGTPSVGQASWGVTVNSSLPLWSVVSEVLLPDGSGNDSTKYWLGPLQNIQGNALLQADSSLKSFPGASGSQKLIQLDPVPRTGTFRVDFDCRVSINKPGTLLLAYFVTNSTQYPTTGLGQTGRSTFNLDLSSGYEDVIQGVPGSENMAMTRRIKVAKGDVIRVDFSVSQTCDVIFNDVYLAAEPSGPPNLGDPFEE